MAKTQDGYSEPDYVMDQEKAQSPFWRPTIAERTPPETHELLETYSKVPRGEHDDHIHSAHERLWEIRQYPCTGLGGWLKPQMCLSPVYPEVLARAKTGETVVDIGTFIGHDLRRLVFDGAPSDNLWGVDIVNHFDVGFDFFRDRERWKGKFVEADFLTIETSGALQPLRGKVDIIFLASVLHQWDWQGQLSAAMMLTYFTKPGSLITGLQMGKPVAGEVTVGELKVPLFIHTPESFANLWNEAGESTSTKWETEAWPRSWGHIGVDPADMAWMGADVKPFEFAVRRVC